MTKQRIDLDVRKDKDDLDRDKRTRRQLMIGYVVRDVLIHCFTQTLGIFQHFSCSGLRKTYYDRMGRGWKIEG